MINRHGAFLVGYTVPIVGIHFNAVELLAEAGRGATGELSARVKAQIDSFMARRDGVVRDVRIVLAQLEHAEVDAGAPPKLPADYYAWSDRIAAQFKARFATQAETVAIDSARLVGHALGNALQSLNLALIVEHLRGAEPTHAWLTAQARALGDDQASAARVLDKVAALGLLTDEARDVVRAIADEVRACPAAGASDPDAAVAPIQAAMRTIAAKVPLVEKTFAPG